MERIRKLLLVNEGEGRQLMYFMLLLLCLGAGMAIGRSTADALFLKRYGVEYLPHMYVVLGLLCALSFTLYAAFIDRLSPERFFSILLAVQASLLVFFWIAMVYTGFELVYPAYYLLYELISEIFILHATFYVAKNLDTLQSKRLMPLILSGYQAGMVVGGLLLAQWVPVIGVENMIVAWCMLLGVGTGMLKYWHKAAGVSPFYIPPPTTNQSYVRKAVKEVAQGFSFIRQSSLLKYSSYSLFFMVIMYYAMTFSVNRIYVESFATEEELTAFFGYLVAVINITALVLQLFVSNRLVERIGVKRAKLVYPVTTLISYLLMLVSPGFYAAVIASMNNGSIMPAVRNPVRQMFFNVLPDYMKGRARATSVALVMPLALLTCGALLMYLQSSHDYRHVIYFGFACALMYLWFCHRMGAVYVDALVESLKEKLYLPRSIGIDQYRGCDDRVYDALIEGLEKQDEDVSMSYARLLLEVYPERSRHDVLRRMQLWPAGQLDKMIRYIDEKTELNIAGELLDIADKHDNHLRATVYSAIFSRSAGLYRGQIESMLAEDNPRIQSCAVKGGLLHTSTRLHRKSVDTWRQLLAGSDKHVFAALELYPLLCKLDMDEQAAIATDYTQALTRMLVTADDHRKKDIYRIVSAWDDSQAVAVEDMILHDLNSHSPLVRRAAAACLHLAPDPVKRRQALWRTLADGHVGVRKAALEVIARMAADPVREYGDWLQHNRDAQPRALYQLVEAFIAHGGSHVQLQRVLEYKMEYAFTLLDAWLAIRDQVETDHERLALMVLEERIDQMVNLMLRILEQIMASDTLAVIRTGLASRSIESRANAHEALQSHDGGKFVDLMSDLVSRKYNAKAVRGTMARFTGMEDALSWCIMNGDDWMRACCSRVVEDTGACNA